MPIPVHEYESLPSTMEEATRLRETGEAMPFAVLAKEQSAGVGRSGREWYSPRGGLWITAVWPTQGTGTRAPSAGLIVGLAVAETLHSLYGLTPRIKWPNDILLADRKVAGILCRLESNSRALHIGIGINADFPVWKLGENLRQPPTTLREHLHAAVDLDELRAALLDQLEALLTEADRWGFAPFLPHVRRRLAWRGADVAFHANGDPIRGRLADIDEHGALIVVGEDAMRSFMAGEVERLEKQG